MPKNNDSIPLHPKYGLNPTMGVCFWCDGDTGEIILLGNNFKEEAPRRITVDYSPCEKCQSDWSKGFTIFEVESKPIDQGQPPLNSNGDYPTGRFAVISKESAISVFGDLGNGDRGLTDKKTFEKLFKDFLDKDSF